MNILLVGGMGYIGSYLYTYLTNLGFKVDICDHTRNKNSDLRIAYPYNYNALTSKDLTKYKAILWFAGHSSVSEANADPIGALNNNMINLIDFLKKIPNEETLFIYASTASLYTGAPGPTKEDARILPYENAYDISKFSFDYLAQRFHKNLIGLRMGTLAGFSSNIRPELIFNSMVLNAIFQKKIYMANKNKLRSILFLSDLAEIIKIFLTAKEINPGFYNASSYTFSIGELGNKIAKIFDATISLLPDSETYSFSVNNEKIKSLGFKVTMSLEDQVKKFVADVQSSNYNQKI